MTSFTSANHVALPASYHNAVRPTLHVSSDSGAVMVNLSSGNGRRTSQFELDGGTLGFHASSIEGAYNVTVVAGSQTIQLDGNRFDRQQAAGSANSEHFYDAQSGLEGDRLGVLSLDHGSETFLIVGSPTTSGLFALTESGGSWQTAGSLGDSATTYLDSPHVLAQYQTGGQTLIFAASQGEAGVTSVALDGSGTMTVRDSLGASDGLGISQPSCLTVIEVDGNPILLLGSAQTGTLTSMSISPTGELAVLDHVEDTLNTRFGQTSVLEAISVNGLTYVLAGGADDGLTAFALLPDGRLVHLDSMADTAHLGLSSVNGLKLAAEGDVLHVFASSEDTPGLSHLTIDTGGFGQLFMGGASAENFTGTVRDDLLADGSGADTLDGAGGEDIFILRRDARRDVIRNFVVADDRIDLSDWPSLYSVAQLTITNEGGFTRIAYGDEQLDIYLQGGGVLLYEDFIQNDILGLYRPPLPDTDPLVLTGTDAVDQLVGSSVGDTLAGLGGDDILDGRNGNDRLEGGSGHDTLFGGHNDDFLLGGSGNDSLEGGDGNDSLMGEAGNDFLDGGTGHDSLAGGDGQDTLYGQVGNDTLLGDSATDLLFGGHGDDSLRGGTENDTLHGGDGQDTLYGNTDTDTLYGGAGDDFLSTGDGVDRAEGGAGNDTIHGRGGADVLLGGDGNDSIYGSGGNDTIEAGAGNDWISAGDDVDHVLGGAGNDTLYGNFGADVLMGDVGNDLLFGGSGDDTLQGGDGDDSLQGNHGDDRLEGSAGDDLLRGGLMNDTFVFATGHDRDEISDFALADDQLLFSQALVGGRTSAADILSTYASVHNGTVLFDFGNGDQLILTNVSSLTGLESVIDVF